MTSKYTIFGVEVSKGAEFAIGLTDLEWSETNKERLNLNNFDHSKDPSHRKNLLNPIEAKDVFHLEEFPSISEARESVLFWITLFKTFGLKSFHLDLGSSDGVIRLRDQ